MPDIKKVMSKDSQAGTIWSTRSHDQKVLKEKLTPITDGMKADVENLMKVYKIDEFWDDVILENPIM